MSCETMTRAITPKIGDGSFHALVLADAGSDMWFVRARFQQPPEVGTQFSFQGIDWQIAWSCDKGYGAQPTGQTVGNA